MRFKLYDSGETAELVASGKAEWADDFTPEEPTHCMNVRQSCAVPAQLRVEVGNLFEMFPHVMGIVAPDIGRTWLRGPHPLAHGGPRDAKFHEPGLPRARGAR